MVIEEHDHISRTINTLNELTSLAYPGYSADNKMYGRIVQLTLGKMYQNVYGIISNIQYTIDNESPWYLDSGITIPHVIDVAITFIFLQHYNTTDGKHFWNKDTLDVSSALEYANKYKKNNNNILKYTSSVDEITWVLRDHH